jgi:hypothetical protein
MNHVYIRDVVASNDRLSGITLEFTGTHRHWAARRKLTSTLRGPMPVRVRGERPVRPHLRSASMKSSGLTSAWRRRPARVPTFSSGCIGTTQPFASRRSRHGCHFGVA